MLQVFADIADILWADLSTDIADTDLFWVDNINPKNIRIGKTEIRQIMHVAFELSNTFIWK